MSGGRDVSYELGRLTQAVEGLREDFAKSEEHSRQHRATVYNQLEDVRGRLTPLETDMHRVMTEVKPVTDDVRSWKQQGVGVLATVGIVASAAGAFISAYGGKLLAFFLSRS